VSETLLAEIRDLLRQREEAVAAPAPPTLPPRPS
jgi:hypothetical protein